jgi:hypothetical protein
MDDIRLAFNSKLHKVPNYNQEMKESFKNNEEEENIKRQKALHDLFSIALKKIFLALNNAERHNNIKDLSEIIKMYVG